MLFLFYTVVFCVCVGTLLVYADKQRKHKRTLFKQLESSCKFPGSGTQWSNQQHEFHVERFYESGLTGKHDFHGGYLNFGYWENGNKDYIKASEALLSQVADPVHLNGDSRLLDVANGTGMQDLFFLKKYKPKHIDMIDVTLTHHLICKKRIAEQGLEDRLTAHYGSAVDLPFQDNSFTHIISIEGGIHYQTRRDFLKQAFRVLQPNGWLSQADFTITISMPRKPNDFITDCICRLCGKMWSASVENYLDAEQLKKCMEEIGFVDVVLKDVGHMCIPGYYSESTRAETMAELSKARGWFHAYVTGRLIDELLRYVYQRGILSEVIIYGRKPMM